MPLKSGLMICHNMILILLTHKDFNSQMITKTFQISICLTQIPTIFYNVRIRSHQMLTTCVVQLAQVNMKHLFPATSSLTSI
jgi:hypothetical protein